MKRVWRKLLGLVALLLVLLSVGSMSFASDMAEYTLLIYLNGTDLESSYDTYEGALAGNATKDLNEMIEGYQADKGVNVIVHTGGTLKWANDFVSSEEMQRFELTDQGFKLVSSLPNQNMGYKKTLSDFIVWGTRNYPAKKTALIMWNHGAGPVNGYGYDELFEGDSLHLEELEAALEDAKLKSKVEFEVIGFDACLMASIEVADVLDDYGNYMVASEELEPGHGWNYQAILKGLNADPSMDGQALGKIIVDSYYQQAVANESESDITLSVVALPKISTVVKALEELVTESTPLIEDDLFFYDFARTIVQSKSFGGNTEQQGYTDIIDLKSWAAYLAVLQPEKSEALVKSIDEAVVYKVEGTFTSDTSGLSIYFPYRDQDYYQENMALYKKTSFSPIYKTYLENFKKRMTTLVGDGLIAYKLNEPTEENPCYQLVLEPEEMNKVYYVYIDLVELVEDAAPGQAAYKFLGTDFLVTYDETTNSFYEDFYFNWTFLGDQPLLTYVVTEYPELVEYESPVLYNGEQMNLLFAWVNEYATEGENIGEVTGGHYEIYGLRRGIDPATGMPDKNLYQLEVGDQLTPLYVGYTHNNRELMIEGNPIVIEETTELTFGELSGNRFQVAFSFVDFAYNTHQTEFFEIYREE